MLAQKILIRVVLASLFLVGFLHDIIAYSPNDDIYNTRNPTYQVDNRPSNSATIQAGRSSYVNPSYVNPSNPYLNHDDLRVARQWDGTNYLKHESYNNPYIDGTYNSLRTYNDTYYNSYNTNSGGLDSPGYIDSYPGRNYGNQGSPYHMGQSFGVHSSLNRDYSSNSDYDFNRATVTTSTSSGTLTEAQLLGQLNSQVRAVYLSLDPESKALAIELASQDSYRDKNLAVKEAQRRMNQRYGIMSR